MVTLPMPDENFITNPRLMIYTRLFATVLERLVLFHAIKTALTKNDSRLLEANFQKHSK